MVNAGALRHQVRIEKQSTSRDAAGQPLEQWTLFALRRAAIQRTPGSEIFAAQERNGRVPTVFRLRWVDGVLPAMRLLFGGKVYDIQSATDPDGLKDELVISALELVEEPQ